MTLQFSGERFLPECTGEMVYEHWHRYLLAQHYVTGKRVLDVASGEGYGTHFLAKSAEEIVGVDISPEAINHATQKYVNPTLRYVTASCTKIPEPDQSFDVIVSFETIEHITEQKAFLKEVNRLLKLDGLFIISSPNRPEYSERTGHKNKFHVKELDHSELAGLLDTYFPAQRWFGQRAAFHSMIWPLNSTADSVRILTTDGLNSYPPELYFLVFCSRQASTLLPIEPQLTLVSDHDLSVYAEWSKTYRVNAELHQLNQSLQAALDAMKQQSHAISYQSEPWLVRLARKLSGQ